MTCDSPDASPLFMRRRATADAAVDNLRKLDSVHDKDYQESVARCLLSPLNEFYFRSRLVGFGRLPERTTPTAPLIYVSNHAGMAFPWDAMAFSCEFSLSKGPLRALVAPNFADSLQPFLIRDFWLKIGGVVATYPNFESLMHQSEADVLVYPEGVNGICKGFDKRYQIQRIATSVVRQSIAHKTPIVPFATVNSEYINPFTYTWRWLNRVARKCGLPYVPLGPSLLLPFIQPWCFYLALPANLTYVLGIPFDASAKVQGRPLEEVSEQEIRAITGQLQAQMQRELAAAVAKYGQHPYDFPSFWKQQWQSGFRYFPLLWTPLFRSFERRFQATKQQVTGSKLVHKMVSAAPLSVIELCKKLVTDPRGLLLHVPIVGVLVLVVGRLKNLHGPSFLRSV